MRILVASLVVSLAVGALPVPTAQAQDRSGGDKDVTPREVYDSIERAKRWLIRQQRADGSWRAQGEQYRVGVSSLALLALLNCGMTPKDPEIQKGLKYLRSVDPLSVTWVYEASLMLQAFATAKDGKTDVARMTQLVTALENCQVTNANSGLWDYRTIGGAENLGGDRSNGQFAVLGLREAQEAGVPVKLEVWQRARDHWQTNQNPDGGWGYRVSMESIGSMTVAGIATMQITEAMARWKAADQDKLDCCGERAPDTALERGCEWMGRNFSAVRNPGSEGSPWWMYYMYGLERAGRLSGRRFFGGDDWYREGVKVLVHYQQAEGHWETVSRNVDVDVTTSFAVLFLSKGLAPVLINKLQYGPVDNQQAVVGADWNNHRDDARNLTQFITSLDRWPKLLNWQIVELPRATLPDLLQSKVLLLNGRGELDFSDEQVTLLRQYIDQGGFIFAEASCKSDHFDTSFRGLVKRMFPEGDARLERLKPEHPVYRAEYLLDPGKDASLLPLEGVDVGCRTAIIYSHHNELSCLWDHWTSFPLPNRTARTNDRITRGMKMGVNIVAYATGREVPDKLQPRLVEVEGTQDAVERGLIQIAKIRYTGDWDAAPQALRNLLLALNRTVGPVAATKQRSLLAQDANIFKYPMLYLHGRENFDLSPKERENLKLYLQRGNVLFVDACCSAPQFDTAFRRLMQQTFPEHPLKRIPPEHAMFKASTGHDLQRVKRRELNVDSPDAALALTVREGPPLLEGIEINGAYAVIYSKYDLSCALEKQSSVACAGYVHEDAVKIAVNVVLYAMLQQPEDTANAGR